MNFILKLTMLSLICSLAANAKDMINIPPIPTAKEINKAVAPLVIECNSSTLPVSEDELKNCYETHPFFLEVLMLISDVDFLDQEKSSTRIELLKIEINKNKESAEICLNKVIQYAKEKTDIDNQKYVQKRMSEISSIIHGSN